ncbi:MAG TPA: alpha/beta hydrolase [Chitinophagaceae bacterium]|nr:alpha/beta hydrolase [Chitinophagaceae bacterium]
MTSLILLHGAIGSAEQFNSLAIDLSNSCNIHAMNFHGHGGSQIPAESFSIRGFSEQVRDYINELNISGPVNIFGYSMGGYVAMYMARHSGTSIGKIITLGTKFHWDEPTAARECKMLQPDIIEQKIPAFAWQLQQRHHPQPWKDVLHKTAEMLQHMGKHNPLQASDYAHIQVPSLIMLGDKDKMVSREETIEVYEQLPNAQLAILPGTPHPIEQADNALLAFHIRRFLQ